MNIKCNIIFALKSCKKAGIPIVENVPISAMPHQIKEALNALHGPIESKTKAHQKDKRYGG